MIFQLAVMCSSPWPSGALWAEGLGPSGDSAQRLQLGPGCGSQRLLISQPHPVKVHLKEGAGSGAIFVNSRQCLDLLRGPFLSDQAECSSRPNCACKSQLSLSTSLLSVCACHPHFSWLGWMNRAAGDLHSPLKEEESGQRREGGRQAFPLARGPTWRKDHPEASA